MNKAAVLKFLRSDTNRVEKAMLEKLRKPGGFATIMLQLQWCVPVHATVLQWTQAGDYARRHLKLPRGCPFIRMATQREVTRRGKPFKWIP